MHLSVPFILQNFKKNQKANSRVEDVPFSGLKWSISPEQNFFGANHYHYFHLSIDPFHCVKFKKIPTANPEL